MGITRIPPGWQAQSMATSHPSANNTDFRKERSRDLGRPAGMPLMQIRLDSSGHNYSSARFDAQIYQNANRVIQGSLGGIESIHSFASSWLKQCELAFSGRGCSLATKLLFDGHNLRTLIQSRKQWPSEFDWKTKRFRHKPLVHRTTLTSTRLRRIGK